jgi:putative ABC transport system ATP-binding protein
MDYAIEASGICKDYQVGGAVSHVLCDVSVAINPGEFVSIMGPSGSGKSTLLYILGGLDSPTRGSVLMSGRDISKFDDAKKSVMRRRNIGFVFQFYNLIPNLNVAENVLLPVLLDGKKVTEYEKRLKELLALVGLSDKHRHTPRELSGGQQQRVAIARALISEPEIIFADEPTGNLDSKTGTEILHLLQKINQERGKTILMVTHSKSAAGYGDRTIWVQDGRIVPQVTAQ